METLKKSIAAGMMISIGAVVYLANDNKIVGAFMFAVGLFTICFFGMNLFTGKIGYMIDNKNDPNCLTVWLGNLIGCVAASALIRFAKPELSIKAAEMMSTKFSQNSFATMVLAFFCGVLMYIAVENYRANKNDTAKIVGIFLCVPTFILSGFEHSIANMCYAAFGVSNFQDGVRSFLFILVVSLFNGLGAIVIRALTKSKTA